MDTVTLDHMKNMRTKTIDGNTRHLDNDIGRTGLANLEDIEIEGIKLQVRRFILPDASDVTVLATHRFLTDFSFLEYSSVGSLGMSQWQAQYEPKRRKNKTQAIVAHQSERYESHDYLLNITTGEIGVIFIERYGQRARKLLLHDCVRENEQRKDNQH